MSATKPVAFIIGYGSNVGTGVARKFKAEGFNVAVSGRSLDPPKLQAEEGLLGVRFDASKASEIAGAFEQVERAYGPIGTVIFNIGNASFAPGGAADPLSLPFEDFVKDATADGINAYKVAKYAKAGFDKLPKGQATLFIATGNLAPWHVFPGLLGLSVGKRALASIVETCATVYGPQGKRFYFAFEVNPQGGGPAMPPDGASHGEAFYNLYKQKEQGPWDVRFVKGGKLWTGIDFADPS